MKTMDEIKYAFVHFEWSCRRLAQERDLEKLGELAGSYKKDRNVIEAAFDELERLRAALAELSEKK